MECTSTLLLTGTRPEHDGNALTRLIHLPHRPAHPDRVMGGQGRLTRIRTSLSESSTSALSDFRRVIIGIQGIFARDTLWDSETTVEIAKTGLGG